MWIGDWNMIFEARMETEIVNCIDYQTIVMHGNAHVLEHKKFKLKFNYKLKDNCEISNILSYFLTLDKFFETKKEILEYLKKENLNEVGVGVFKKFFHEKKKQFEEMNEEQYIENQLISIFNSENKYFKFECEMDKEMFEFMKKQKGN